MGARAFPRAPAIVPVFTSLKGTKIIMEFLYDAEGEIVAAVVEGDAVLLDEEDFLFDEDGDEVAVVFGDLIVFLEDTDEEDEEV